MADGNNPYNVTGGGDDDDTGGGEKEDSRDYTKPVSFHQPSIYCSS